MEDVFAAGKAHGVHKSDLFGSLYFHIADQLRNFADRIRRFNISFFVFNELAQDLPKRINQGVYKSIGLNSNTLFDRVDVSNLLDENYQVEIKTLLSGWGSLVNKRNRYATLVGYFINWIMFEPRAVPSPVWMGEEKYIEWLKARMDRAEVRSFS